MVEHIRHPPSKRNDAGGNPAGSSIARWCQSSMAVCYTVRCWCESNPGSQFQGVMSAADGLVRNEEDAGAIPATLTISGRQADISWLHLSRKQDRHRRGESITRAFRHCFLKRESRSHITPRT